MEFDLNFSKIGVNIDSNGKSLDKNSPLIATPIHIANDMVELFPENQFDNNHIFMDLYCKTGNLLKAIKQKIDSSDRLIAICDNKQSQMLVCRVLYGKLYEEIDCSTEINTITRRGQVYYIAKYKDIVKNRLDEYIVNIFKTIKEQYMLEFKPEDDFKINNIIMNPPYNPSDLYIDFVTLAHKVASDNVVAITPAKWQAKGGEKNEQFRKNIVPHMSKIVYYPDCGDVFDIRLQGGIAYYICDKAVCNSKQIEQSCERVSQFNGKCNRQFNQTVFLDTDICYSICDKVGCFNSSFRNFNPTWTPIDGNINIFITAINTDAGGKTSFNVYSNNGNLTMLAPFNRSKETFFRSNDTKCIFSAHDDREADSFESWCGSKFVRFMLLMRYCSYHNNNDYSWKFVPDPGNFDHIFTDAELYEKYHLTDEEIAIIESVIKERK